jgi:alcohol dehydrogenase
MEGGEHATPVPMDKIIGRELEIIGSHGMQSYRYPEMLGRIAAGKLDPQKLVEKTIGLDDAPVVLREMNNFSGAGITVIDQF